MHRTPISLGGRYARRRHEHEPALDEREAHLLDYPEGTPVFFQSGIIYDEKNEPVEYFKNIVLSDHIRFASELRSEVEE